MPSACEKHHVTMSVLSISLNPWRHPGLTEDDLWSFRPPSVLSATINNLSRKRFVDFLILKILNDVVKK